MLVSDPSWAVKWYDEESAARDARGADAMVEDCSQPDQGTDGHGLTDLNGIALRLCVRGHASVQEAIKDAAEACHIRKVAVVGLGESAEFKLAGASKFGAFVARCAKAHKATTAAALTVSARTAMLTFSP